MTRGLNEKKENGHKEEKKMKKRENTVKNEEDDERDRMRNYGKGQAKNGNTIRQNTN